MPPQLGPSSPPTPPANTFGIEPGQADTQRTTQSLSSMINSRLSEYDLCVPMNVGAVFGMTIGAISLVYLALSTTSPETEDQIGDLPDEYTRKLTSDNITLIDHNTTVINEPRGNNRASGEGLIIGIAALGAAAGSMPGAILGGTVAGCNAGIRAAAQYNEENDFSVPARVANYLQGAAQGTVKGACISSKAACCVFMPCID